MIFFIFCHLSSLHCCWDADCFFLFSASTRYLLGEDGLDFGASGKKVVALHEWMLRWVRSTKSERQKITFSHCADRRRNPKHKHTYAVSYTSITHSHSHSHHHLHCSSISWLCFIFLRSTEIFRVRSARARLQDVKADSCSNNFPFIAFSMEFALVKWESSTVRMQAKTICKEVEKKKTQQKRQQHENLAEVVAKSRSNVNAIVANIISDSSLLSLAAASIAITKATQFDSWRLKCDFHLIANKLPASCNHSATDTRYSV